MPLWIATAMTLAAIMLAGSANAALVKGSNQDDLSSNGLSLRNELHGMQAEIASQEYWTPERMKNAQELTMEPTNGFFAQEELVTELDTQSGEEETTESGQPPVRKFRPDRKNRLFEPDPVDSFMAELDPSEDVGSNAVGTFGAPFSSARVFQQADTVYPYRTIGRLFFTQPGVGDFVCSASVIRKRVIVTAGHCVHNGLGNIGQGSFFTNFRFIPSFRDGIAPFGTWTFASATVTGTWANGGGGVPNAADYAVIELNDLFIFNATRRIGDVTGMLGFHTLSLNPNHLHMIGYPVNFDGGGKMHQVTAQAFRAVAPNNVEYGSDMQGGSSGGPWVENFGLLSVGQTDPGMNRVAGVTSYGYISPDPKAQGASTFDKRFTDIVNLACGRRSGNC